MAHSRRDRAGRSHHGIALRIGQWKFSESQGRLRDVRVTLRRGTPRDGELASADTWEVSLSFGKGKRETFERLIAEKRLGGLALLRNLRLMQKAEVPRQMIADAIEAMRTDRILPYRFITAARYAPDFEGELEAAMLKSIKVPRGCPAARGF